MTTTIDGTQLYNDAIKRIQQLERLNAVLSAEIDRMRPVVDVAREYRWRAFMPRALENAIDAYEAAKGQG